MHANIHTEIIGVSWPRQFAVLSKKSVGSVYGVFGPPDILSARISSNAVATSTRSVQISVVENCVTLCGPEFRVRL